MYAYLFVSLCVRVCVRESQEGNSGYMSTPLTPQFRQVLSPKSECVNVRGRSLVPTVDSVLRSEKRLNSLLMYLSHNSPSSSAPPAASHSAAQGSREGGGGEGEREGERERDREGEREREAEGSGGWRRGGVHSKLHPPEGVIYGACDWLVFLQVSRLFKGPGPSCHYSTALFKQLIAAQRTQGILSVSDTSK